MSPLSSQLSLSLSLSQRNPIHLENQWQCVQVLIHRVCMQREETDWETRETADATRTHCTNWTLTHSHTYTNCTWSLPVWLVAGRSRLHSLPSVIRHESIAWVTRENVLSEAQAHRKRRKRARSNLYLKVTIYWESKWEDERHERRSDWYSVHCSMCSVFIMSIIRSQPPLYYSFAFSLSLSPFSSSPLSMRIAECAEATRQSAFIVTKWERHCVPSVHKMEKNVILSLVQRDQTQRRQREWEWEGH